VVPLFKKQIKNGGPITLTHKDITRFFMTIPEAAQLVLEAASYASGGEIYVLDMGKPVKIYDLAVNLIRLSGLEPYQDIDIEITGLRSGEKLHEEILMDDEGLRKTANNKIFIAKPVTVDFPEFEAGLKELLRAADTHDCSRIRGLLANLVDTYTYQGAAKETGDAFDYVYSGGGKRESALPRGFGAGAEYKSLI
ncbi:MAG: polysaccharide biosynthesis protein, partial [Clostridiales bacterium]|nr:polysaccharide biosynthesis protein [Clostridiales bacterium]